jgi:hypothetical protein
MHRTRLVSPLLFAAAVAGSLAGCGNPVEDDHFTNRAKPAAIPAGEPVRHVVPVRVGELGPNFDACAAAGTTRHLAAGQTLTVREAPFESARQTGAIAAGRRFFVCSRSHDQKWLGVVFEESGALAEACGVSTPVERRQDYKGRCRSGWVASAFVRTVAGVEQPAAAATAPVESNQAGAGARGG